MNFNDLRVKLTNNQNYKSLSENGQKQLNALLNSYESLHNKAVTEFGENIKRIRESEIEKANRRAKWGTFFAFTPIGIAYNGAKGLAKGLVNLFSGGLVLAGQFANNVGKIFEFEGRFGDDFKAWSKELNRDFAYAILDPIYSINEGISRGVLSFENILGITDDEEFNKKLRHLDTSYEKERYETLYGKYPGSFFPSWVDNPEEKQKTQEAISEHYYEWSEDWARGVATSTNWVNNNIVEPALKYNPIFLGSGYAMDELGTTKWGDFAAGTAESMGRMIPAIAASYYGVPPAYTKAYFFSTTFGGAYSEAIEKGADIRSAYDYAYSVASIETLTEEIGGVQLGKILPSNILKSAVEEGSEELISELMSAGVEHIISGEDATNEDILERGIFAVLGGAISGGVFAGGGQYVQNRTVQGSNINLHNEIVSIHKENNGDYVKTEKKLRKIFNQVLRSYNSENRILNNYFDKNGSTPEQRLEAKKQFLNEQIIAKHLIEYNEKSGEFQLTKQAQDILNDVKGYMDGKWRGDAIDKDNVLVSEKTDGGLEFHENVVPATREDLAKMSQEKQDYINQSLKESRNLMYFDMPLDAGIDAFFDPKNAVLYINMNLETNDIINKTIAHEKLHKIKATDSSGYNSLVEMINDKAIIEALNKVGVELLSESEIARYRELYDQLGRSEAEIDAMIEEETIANFVENILNNAETIGKLFRINPKLMQPFESLFKGKDYAKVNKKVGKIQKRFASLVKKANMYDRGSLVDAVKRGFKQTTYIKAGDVFYKVPKELTGFFNTNHELNVKAGLNEKHSRFTENGYVVEGYSEFSKAEILDFLRLFEINDNIGNNVDKIIDHLVKEYDNFTEYKEIIGTKFSYMWTLFMIEPDIRKQFVEAVEKRIANIYETKSDKLTKVDGHKNLFSTDAETFRDIFALNYIIIEPSQAASVSLYPTIVYKQEADHLFIFNEGKGGFIVSKPNEFKTSDYDVFYSVEWGSAFNNGGETKMSEFKDFLLKDLRVQTAVATNSKLEEVYISWGFGDIIHKSDYSPEIMGEWSNSYTNFLVFGGKLNNATPVYRQLVVDQGQGVKYKLRVGDDSVDVEIESYKGLTALHNLTAEKFLKTLELGGFPMPSIAVLPSDIQHTNFGDITVVFGKDTIDPKISRRNKVWAGDKWTPTVPLIEYDFDYNTLYEIAKEFNTSYYSLQHKIDNFGLEYGVERIINEMKSYNEDTYNKLFLEEKIQKNNSVYDYVLERVSSAIKQTGIYNGVERITNNGRRSFKATHYTVSAENMVKAMLKKNSTAGFNYGLGSLNAAYIRDFNSIEEMKASINKIVDEETYKADYRELETKLANLIYSITEFKTYKNENSFIDFSNTETILQELAKKGVSTENIENWYKEYNIKGDEQLTHNILEFFDDLSRKYIRYFEAKPERVVGFDEIKTVIFNDNSKLKTKEYQELIKRLDKAGIKHEVVSEKGISDNLEKAHQNFGDVLFKIRQGQYQGDSRYNEISFTKESREFGGVQVPAYIFKHGDAFLDIYYMPNTNEFSVMEFSVPKSEIKSGLGTLLLAKATEHINRIYSQVYDVDSIKSHYQAGFRLDNDFDNGLNKTIDILQKSQRPVNMVYEAAQNFTRQGKLVNIHNLDPYYLLHQLRMYNGLLVPSVATTDYRYDFTKFGSVSVYLNSRVVDPTIDPSHFIYAGDAWTKTFPDTFHEINKKALYDFVSKIGGEKERSLSLFTAEWKSRFYYDDIIDYYTTKQSLLDLVKNYLDKNNIVQSPEMFIEENIRNIFSEERMIKFDDGTLRPNNVDNLIAYFKEKQAPYKMYGDFNLDWGIIAGTLLKPLKTKNQIYEAAEKLIENVDLNAEPRIAFEEFGDKIDAFIEKLPRKEQRNLENIIGQAAENYLKGVFLDGDYKKTKFFKTFESDLAQLFDILLNTGIGYLEGKPERVVHSGEMVFVAFRDKSDVSVELIEELDKRYIPYVLVNSEQELRDKVLEMQKEFGNVLFKINPEGTRQGTAQGLDNKKEIKRLGSLTKRVYDNYEKSDYEKATTKRTRYINDIDFNELGKKNNGKKIVELIKDLQEEYKVVIKKNHTRSEIYNHMFNNVLQEIIIQLESNYEGTGFLDYNKMIDSIESAIISTMPYVDDTYTMNEKTKTNPKGLQYTKLIHHGFRDLYNAKTQKDYNNILKNKNFDPIWNLFDGLIKLNVADKSSIDLFNAGLKKFKNATHVEQRNSMSLRSSGTHVETIPVVLEQNHRHIDNVLALVGKPLLDGKDGKKGKYSRDGLLGDLRLLDKFSPARLDMYAVGNIYGLHMDDSTGKIMVKRIEQAQRQQLEVSNAFYDYFEKDGYLKQNENKISALEEQVSTINNLVDSDNKPIVMPNSQVIRLRDLLKREIIRTRLIENGHRGGEISNHFKDNGIIYIDDNTSDRRKNIANRREVKIVNLIDLFNEVDTIVREHDFMENYSKKTRGFYALLYEYENARFKDIRGLELTNDQVLIDSLSQKEIDALVDGLNDGVDLTNIYVPMRTIGSNKAGGAGAFNINNVIDLGIDDGLVMGITESSDAPAIDSVNLNVPGYMRSVANYYGLYRIVNDLNILFEKRIDLPDGSWTTLAIKTNQISPYIIPYFEKLLRDMSGYRVQSDSTKESFNKGMGIIKRNFFKASLGANIKVIATQFGSAFTLATIHGDYSGTRLGFTMRMFANMIKRGSKTRAKYLIENSEIYKDRARNSTYEVSEATKNEFLKGKLSRFTEFLMRGINVTDSMINRAFFITLVEEGYSQEEALRITEEGMNRYQSAGLAITKNELLRTEHEVLRLFMKFLSEPMKMTSNIEDSQKQLAIINSFEKNKTDIFKHFDNIVENEINTLNELNEAREEIQEKLAKEKDAEKIEALEKEKAKIDKDITKQEKVVEAETENANNIKNSIENVISQKAEAKKLLAKRVTAFTVSVNYQALLGMVFGLLIRGGIKDRDKDEAMWKFLGKQYGWQLAGEMIGMFPIVRDIYGLIVDGYAADRIGEFQAFNNLGNAVRNLWTDIANGGDFNYGKHLRAVAMYLGQSLGIPTRQLERFFTSPASWFAQSWAYNYKSATGQFIAGSELNNAIRDGNTKLVETIMKDKMNQKGVLLTHATSKEINRLATNGVIVSPSGVPNTFTIDGIEYKNDKNKFSRVYNNATFVIEKIIAQGSYKRLDDEHKGKLIKAIFTYYHNLAKQEVSGVEIFTKDRVYTLNQAFSYFNGRIPYYLTLQRKNDAKKRRAN